MTILDKELIFTDGDHTVAVFPDGRIVSMLDGEDAMVVGRIREGQPLGEIIEMLMAVCFYDREDETPEHIRQSLREALETDDRED